jgi:hypothetical protein
MPDLLAALDADPYPTTLTRRAGRATRAATNSCQFQHWWPQGGAIAGPFPIRLPVGGTLTLKAA